MSSHDNHASCPQCWMAAGECSLDSENPCTTCKVWTRRQWGKLRRSLIDARARSCQRGRQHWSAAFPQLEAWIQSKPASTSSSEISSQAGEGDFEEDTLVGTPEQQVMQVAGPSTIEPIVEQLGQDTPSVIQGARPDVRIEQTVQSTQRYGTLPYIPGPQYTAPLPHFTAPLPQYTAPTAPLLYVAPYANMPAMSARPATPMGYYGQGNQFPFAPNPGWMTDEELFQQQQLIREKQELMLGEPVEPKLTLSLSPK